MRLVIPGIAVPPGVTHSDSRIVFVTGTVVKPQQPTGKTTYVVIKKCLNRYIALHMNTKKNWSELPKDQGVICGDSRDCPQWLWNNQFFLDFPSIFPQFLYKSPTAIRHCSTAGSDRHFSTYWLTGCGSIYIIFGGGLDKSTKD